MRSLAVRTCTLASAISVALGGCTNMPASNRAAADGGASGGNFVLSCATGAAIGAGAVVMFEVLKNKRSTQDVLKSKGGTLAAAAAAGCAIGLAATAVGKLLDQRKQAAHEEAVQRAAKRQARELQTYAQIEQRGQMAPAQTAAQRDQRDKNLAQARENWERNYTKPDVTNQGDGVTTTIVAIPPQEAPAAGQQAGCFSQSVLVETPSGKAKQIQTMCPDKTGKYVRAEVEEQPA